MFDINMLKRYYKEESQKININPRLKTVVMENSKYIIEENKGSNQFILGRFKAICLILNTPTQNGTYYTTAWAENTLIKNEKFQERLKKKLILGKVDHPDKPDAVAENASHALVDVEIKGNEVWGTFEVFNTKPYGENLWVLLNANVILGLSLRGLGDETYTNGMKKIREDNFELIAIDIVVDASSIGSEFKEFAEGKKKEILNKVVAIKNDYSNNYTKYFIESLVKDEKTKEKITILEERIKELESNNNYIKESTDKNKVIVEKYLKENNKLTKDLNQLNAERNSLKLLLESRDVTISNLRRLNSEIEEKNKLLTDEIHNSNTMIEKYKKENNNLLAGKESKSIQVILEGKKYSETENTDFDNKIKSYLKNKNGVLRK